VYLDTDPDPKLFAGSRSGSGTIIVGSGSDKLQFSVKNSMKYAEYQVVTVNFTKERKFS
jgi:hypothetical protein